YYDNVGGEISDAVLAQLNRKARVVVCGAISAYNLTKPDVGPRVQSILIKKSASMEGFTVGDFSDSFKEGAEQMAKWLTAGQLTYRETIREGFDSIPDVFLSLFSGENIGKLIVKVSDPQADENLYNDKHKYDLVSKSATDNPLLLLYFESQVLDRTLLLPIFPVLPK